MRILLLFAVLLLLGCAGEERPPWRVLSFNVWGVPLSADLSRRIERLPEALLSFDADVLCLQELWLPAQRKALSARLRPRYRVASSSDGGLYLASRFPIVEESFTPFADVPGLSLVERIAGKGWLEALVETPRGKVLVVTTHLALEGPRALQLEALLRRLDARRDVPVVLAGDLNTQASDPSFEEVLRGGFRDARPASSGPAVETPTRVGWPRSAVTTRGWSPDHVLVRGLRPRSFRIALETPETAISDHNVLLVEVEAVP